MARTTILGFALFILAINANADDESADTEADAKRGQYLVNISGCGDCHTPWKMGKKGPEPDMSRMLSGHPEDAKITAPAKPPEKPWAWVGSQSFTAFSGPWGVSFSANLTPHETGLGTWQVEDFLRAMRSGKHKGTGRDILPPMPWFNLSKASDEDLRAIWAYLRTVPPIKNQVAMPIAHPKGKQASR